MPAKESLLEALGIKRRVDGHNIWAAASVTPMNYTFCKGRKGFCYADDGNDEEQDDNDADQVKVRATTAIMAALSNHFELNFSDEIVAAPVLYGGRASDGHVVAVLSLRIWT